MSGKYERKKPKKSGPKIALIVVIVVLVLLLAVAAAVVVYYNTVGTACAVDGGGGCVLQDGEALDVLGRNVVEVACRDFNIVEEDKRGGASAER